MKKRLSIVVITVVTTMILLSCKLIDNNWKEFKPKNGNCSIIIPGDPKEDEKIVNSPYGELVLHIFSLQPPMGSDDNIIYSLSYTDYPIGTIHSDSTNVLNDFFNTSRDGIIANIQGKLLSEIIISNKGFPGREQQVDFKNGLAIIRYRHYLVKNRLYMLQVITQTTNNFNISINKFLNSFKLTNY